MQNAIQAIYRDLEYAKTLIKPRTVSSKDALSDTVQNDDLAVDIEESWTFIGDESDPELQRRIRDWDPSTYKDSETNTDWASPKAIAAVKPSGPGKRGLQR